MGCRILDAGEHGAVLFDSTSDWAFGPIFRSAEHAEDFLRWLATDPRELSDPQLENRYGTWYAERCEDTGELKEQPECDCCTVELSADPPLAGDAHPNLCHQCNEDEKPRTITVQVTHHEPEVIKIKVKK